MIVIQEYWGLVNQIARTCDRFAAEGFTALAPDLYHGTTVPLTEPDEAAKEMMAMSMDVTAKELSGTVDELTRRSGRDRVGVIGFCMGGGFALLLAPGHGFAASSVNYGTVPKDAQSLLAGACPIVGSFGGRDRTLRGAGDRLQSALSANDVVHDVKEYPDAGHSFMNDHDPAETPALFVLMRKLIGGGYAPGPAEDARRRIVSFFDTHLKS